MNIKVTHLNTLLHGHLTTQRIAQAKLEENPIDIKPNAVIYVHNKTGEVVFSTLNGYNNDWRGDRNATGRALPSGPYFYTVDRDADGKIDDYGWLYIQN